MHGGARPAALGALAVAAWLWPGKVASIFDGAPLDGAVEALVVGLAVPVLWWFHPAFLRGRLAAALVAALVLLRIADAQFSQSGWCVRFDPAAQIVRDGTGRPHSWDARADWQSPDPACSAVMTAGYPEFKRFPVWFFNLPPPDDNLPRLSDRPPFATTRMSVLGSLDAGHAGALEIQTGPGMDTVLLVDGRIAERRDGLTHRIELEPGQHFVQVDSTLTGMHWRFLPSWNQVPFGAAGFPLVTLNRPSRLDRSALRPAIAWATTMVAGGLVLAWLVSALRAWGDVATLAWAAVAAAWLAYLAPRAGNDYVLGSLARISVAALVLSVLLPIREQLRTWRGAFVVVGIPWLFFIGTAAFDHVAKFSLYGAGEDQWTYQRYAYRIFLQGYWLEGGQHTFWFQPLYRWVAGALHMMFGDSSIGEFFWDGVCFLAMALFAHEVTSRAAGFRWGLAAAATTLAIIVFGPAWSYWGVGLTENTAAGFIYAGALAAMFARGWRLVFLAGVLATLGFYTRLNSLPVAVAVALFVVPVRARARDLWTPSRWIGDGVAWKVATVVGVFAIGLFLFALRTWYYTGVFSVFHGTTLGISLLWQPDTPAIEVARRMVDSLWMVLSMHDPPRLVWYATPLIAATAISVAAVAGVPVARNLPLPLVAFFLAGCAGAMVARGVAYSGRFSTILIAAGCAVTINMVALLAPAAKVNPSVEARAR